MMMDQDDLLRLTGQVDDKYLDEAGGYQPKRSFWKTALGIVVRKLIELLIIMFLIFLAFWFADRNEASPLTQYYGEETITPERGTLPGGGNP